MTNPHDGSETASGLVRFLELVSAELVAKGGDRFHRGRVFLA
jgi:hypothetical protein